MIKVILMTDYSSEYDRRLLRGIMRYSKEHGPWSFYRLSSEYRSGEANLRELAQIAKEWKADAVIGRWADEDLKSLEDLHIPIVLQNYRKRSTVHSNITGDYIGTGVMAADYFYAKSFSSFAFVGISGVLWSDERYVGFSEEVKRRGGQLQRYELDESGKTDMEGLYNWLNALPPKTAVFCCDDERALKVTEVCRSSGIEIPQRLAVLGVDDDELVCCISDPPISSIQLDVEQGGYLLCKRLHQEILHPESNPFSLVIKPVQIIERQSTAKYISDVMVKKVVDYIEKNFSSRIKVEDILKDIPLSRRSIETRFKKETGRSIYTYVLDCRINRVAQLLTTSRKSILQICDESGIQDPDTLSKLFRQRFSCSPNEYRDKFCVFSE
ncbi:MAG: substrate-binding domain-containing protein [Candidatus Cryptobacteroides sp.]